MSRRRGQVTITRQAVTTAAVLAAATALAACSSASSAAAPPAAAVTATPVPANPVPVLRMTGATPDPGEVLGLTDVEGDRYATGSYPGGETVSVYTFATDAAQAAAAARNDIPSDDHAIIRAHLTDIYVTAVQDQAGAYVFTVTPAQIASRVNGKVAGQ